MPPADFGIDESKWETLCDRIARRQVIPVVGSRLRSPPFLLPEELAREWAEDLHYPLTSTSELALVAEYARERAADVNDLLESFQAVAGTLNDPTAVNAIDPDHPIRLLAELPFDTYITTTYDGLLADALRRFRPRTNACEIPCLWKPDDRVWDVKDAEDDYAAEPSQERPIVFYLHGRLAEPDSMVLTESDHMAFTARLTVDRPESAQVTSLFPPAVTNALSHRSWLFLGYSAADHNFRGLLRALGGRVSNTKQVVAVQLQKGDAAIEHRAAADDFLTSYFRRLLGRGRNVDVILADARPFLLEVRQTISAGAVGGERRGPRRSNGPGTAVHP